MKIYDRFASAEGAAHKFAYEAFGEHRYVGNTRRGKDLAGTDSCLDFQLVDGIKWYSVKFLPGYAGWEVVERDAAPVTA